LLRANPLRRARSAARGARFLSHCLIVNFFPRGSAPPREPFPGRHAVLGRARLRARKSGICTATGTLLRTVLRRGGGADLRLKAGGGGGGRHVQPCPPSGQEPVLGLAFGRARGAAPHQVRGRLSPTMGGKIVVPRVQRCVQDMVGSTSLDGILTKRRMGMPQSPSPAATWAFFNDGLRAPIA
jgi:hypothetical protein